MDEARVRRAVLNLIANAVNAMPQGGELAIATDEAGGRWRLSVVDSGPGIPLDQRSQVFEAFATLGKGSETGLGLAIAKEVVEGHGGHISFETRTAGESDAHRPGTTFQIEIPVTPVQAG